MILTPPRRHVATAAVGLVVLAGCGSGEAGSSTSADPVIATTSIWADVTSEVACSEPIRSLIPPGADPHTFEPSLRDRELAEGASTIISNGLGLEESLDDLLGTAGDHEVAVIELAHDVDVIESDHEHDHGTGGDPHVWQDPLRVAGTLDTIASALAAHDVETCTEEYRDELLTLDAEIDATLAVVPDASRMLVTSHDSLAYFADRYRFEVIGTVIPSTSTLGETNAADLAALADIIASHDVPAIFTEELESTVDADALAERLGVAVVPLITDSLTDDPAADTYLEMMRRNAMAIAGALAP